MFAGLFAFVGRVMLALMFIMSGIYRLGALNDADRYMADVGMPASLMLPVALFELIGGIMIALGFFTRLTSFLFAAFCLFSALLLQRSVADAERVAETLKYVAIAGGFLCLFAHNQAAWSLDMMRQRRRDETIRRRAVEQARPTDQAGVGAG